MNENLKFVHRYEKEPHFLVSIFYMYIKGEVILQYLQTKFPSAPG